MDAHELAQYINAIDHTLILKHLTPPGQWTEVHYWTRHITLPKQIYEQNKIKIKEMAEEKQVYMTDPSVYISDCSDPERIYLQIMATNESNCEEFYHSLQTLFKVGSE